MKWLRIAPVVLAADRSPVRSPRNRRPTALGASARSYSCVTTKRVFSRARSLSRRSGRVGTGRLARAQPRARRQDAKAIALAEDKTRTKPDGWCWFALAALDGTRATGRSGGRGGIGAEAAAEQPGRRLDPGRDPGKPPEAAWRGHRLRRPRASPTQEPGRAPLSQRLAFSTCKPTPTSNEAGIAAALAAFEEVRRRDRRTSAPGICLAPTCPVPGEATTPTPSSGRPPACLPVPPKSTRRSGGRSPAAETWAPTRSARRSRPTSSRSSRRMAIALARCWPSQDLERNEME